MLVSCGTEKFPFNRLARITRDYAIAHPDCQILFQARTIDFVPKYPNVEVVEMFSYDKFKQILSTCDKYVCHAGIGCIMTGLMNGIKPIVMARLCRFGEHTDDHQKQIVDCLLGQERIFAFDSQEKLEEALLMQDRTVPYIPNNGALLRDIAEIVDQFCGV